MKKSIAELAVLVGSILLMGLLGALYSLIFAGVAGWTTMGISPAFAFGLVERYVCAPGASIQYVPQTAGAGYAVNCALPDGTLEQGVGDRAVVAVNAMFFLLCFLPTFIPGAFLMRLAIHNWAERASDENSEPVEPDDEA